VVLTVNATSLVAIATGIWTGTSLSRRSVAPPDGETTAWHALTPDQVIATVGSTPQGLTSSDASARLHESPEERTPQLGSLVLAELANPLSVVLGVGGVLSTVAGSVTDGLLITSVLGINALVGAVQRFQTERAISHLGAALSSHAARVRRDARQTELPVEELVDGDLLVLRAGDVVPADARVIDASAVEADESALTGESFPVPKSVDAVASDAAVAERASMVYAGTAIAAGRAEAIVVATGDETEARRGTGGIEPPVTGVEARLDEFARLSVPVTLAAGGLLTGTSLLRGVPAREAVATGVSLAAAAVPEGLPFLATVAQSAAAHRLARRGVLVRNTRVLEALGRVDVLCFDKTGTLTEGSLALQSVSDGDIVESMPVAGARGRRILAAAVRATPHRRSERLPHPTDQAIVDAAAALEVVAQFGASGWKKTASLPFSSTRGYHAVLGRTATGSVLSVKGAPEVVLPRCESRRFGDRVVVLDDRARAQLGRHVEELAARGLRVLAVAEREASGRADLDDPRVGRLELVGFVTVADATRKSAADPIAQLQEAGISVVMLTGDHPRTAEAIGRELGLLDGRVITGRELDQMSDEELDRLLERATVFARVTPAHKVRIVAGYRRLGRVVAMTGDGANDAQAIRLADTGIAFGPRATSAARDAADLVIADDRLETVIAAIVEGRSMWASVRDALALLLGGNLGEVIFTTGATLVTGRSPLNARQLLAVNLLTDLAPALAIALQRPAVERIDLRREGPEVSLGGRLTRDIAVRAGATAAASAGAWTVARFTGTPTRARTVAFAALVGTQLGQTIVAGIRSPVVLASAGVSAGALVTIVQTPGLSQAFGCRPLGPVGWSVAAASATFGTVAAMVAANIVRRSDPPAGEGVRTIDLRGEDAEAPAGLGFAVGA
jgi:cation-transporting ATPase I